MATKPAAKRRGKSSTSERSTADQRFDRAWNPDPLTVWSQRQEDPGGDRPVAIVLQHWQSPFRVTVPASDGEAGLRTAALSYLVRATELAITPPLRLGPRWIEGLAGERDASPVAWAPFGGVDFDGQAIVQPSFASRLITSGRTHGSALLVAAEAVDGQFLGSGFGLKIVLHLRGLAGGSTEVTIIGLTALLPPPRVSDAWSDGARLAINVGALVRELQSLAAPLIEPKRLLIRGVRQVLAKDRIEIHGIVSDPVPGDRSVPSVSDAVVLRVDRKGGSGSVIHRSPQIADATGNVRVFERDPPIRPLPLGARPTRTGTQLDHDDRADETVSDPLEGSIGGVKFKVLPCPRFVRADRTLDPAQARPAMPGGAPPAVPGGGLPPVRSDDASAVQGYYHVRDLLLRFEAYGIDAGQYFTCALPEILIAYRSGISPGPDKDGQGVNARVLPDGWAPDQVGSPKVKTPPRLFLLLALGDRRVRDRKRRIAGGPPMPAEPLGIGADANWMWHEFGHVLLMATTGELELRFAHSPGDALAAIVADPAIVVPANARPAPRYATFPWVCTARRHDRLADHGWGWSGPVHAPLAAVPDSLQPRRKGYLSEQILSSSLFRLYRCLGGDTDLQIASAPERQRASHYTVFLVMRALQLFGDATASPVTTPNGLVSKLIDADYFFWRWEAAYLGATFERVGGTASKLIWWAFEAQGLSWSSTGNPYGPGTPPQVDLYIASRRPTVDAAAGDPVDYGPGSYVPVSLRWQTAASPDVPAWQADPAAIVVATDGTITVTIGNRGQVAAAAVKVDVWWAPWPVADATPPPWNGGWNTVGPSLGVQALAPDARVEVGPFPASGASGRYVLLARATCTADPALIDSSAVLPTPIIDLVAGDNNLALLVVG